MIVDINRLTLPTLASVLELTDELFRFTIYADDRLPLVGIIVLLGAICIRTVNFCEGIR